MAHQFVFPLDAARCRSSIPSTKRHRAKRRPSGDDDGDRDGVGTVPAGNDRGIPEVAAAVVAVWWQLQRMMKGWKGLDGGC